MCVNGPTCAHRDALVADGRQHLSSSAVSASSASAGIGTFQIQIQLSVKSAATFARSSHLGSFQTPEPSFEVAAIKINRTGGRGWMVQPSPGGPTIENASLKESIAWAYSVRPDLILGPEAARSEKYDMTAKSATRASTSETRSMLRALLKERFHLQLIMRQSRSRFTRWSWRTVVPRVWSNRMRPQTSTTNSPGSSRSGGISWTMKNISMESSRASLATAPTDL